MAYEGAVDVLEDFKFLVVDFIVRLRLEHPLPPVCWDLDCPLANPDSDKSLQLILPILWVKETKCFLWAGSYFFICCVPFIKFFPLLDVEAGMDRFISVHRADHCGVGQEDRGLLRSLTYQWEGDRLWVGGGLARQAEHTQQGTELCKK